MENAWPKIMSLNYSSCLQRSNVTRRKTASENCRCTDFPCHPAKSNDESQVSMHHQHFICIAPSMETKLPPVSCLNSVSISGVIKQTGIVFIKSSWLSFCPCRRWNIFKQIPPGGRIEKLKRTFERRFSWVPGPQLDFTEESTYWVPHIIPTPNPGQPFLTPWELSLIELSQNAVCLVYISALFLAELAVYLSAKPFCFLDFLFSLLFDLRGGRTPMSPVC